MSRGMYRRRGGEGISVPAITLVVACSASRQRLCKLTPRVSGFWQETPGVLVLVGLSLEFVYTTVSDVQCLFSSGMTIGHSFGHFDVLLGPIFSLHAMSEKKTHHKPQPPQANMKCPKCGELFTDKAFRFHITRKVECKDYINRQRNYC